MVPPLCRWWIALVSLLVPRSAREDWRKEWLAELAYRERSGASNGYLLRSARGALRDAAWLRAQTPVDLRYFTAPLKAECLLAGAALSVCIWNGGLIPPRPDYSNLERLVHFERDLHILGLTNRFLQSLLLQKMETWPGVEQVAAYNVYVHGPAPYAHVSINFFDVLGARAAQGRLLDSRDDAQSAVITDKFWRTQLHADRRAVGSTFRSGKGAYRAVGILSPGFAFQGCSFFTPLKDDASYFTIALLRRGISRRAAEMQLPKTPEYEGGRRRPLTVPFTVCSIAMAGALVMLAFAHWLLRRRRIALYTAARIAAALLSIAAINLAMARSINRTAAILSVAQFWLFCGLCAAVVYFVLRDQRSRCPVCFERLRMPAPIGSWSSLILDRPATEYVCPAGHGVLLVSEALHGPNEWTALDESWRDLFAGTTT